MTNSANKSKMNKEINEANKQHKKNIENEFIKKTDNKKFIDLIKNASGEEDEELVTLINKTFTFLKTFNVKALNATTSKKLIDDMYTNTKKQLMEKMTSKGKSDYENSLNAYLDTLKDLTFKIKDIKTTYNSVTTEIYICEDDCKKYDENKELPDLFTACAIQTRKNKTPEVHCKKKKSMKANKEDKNWLGMFSGGSKKKKRKSRRCRRKI